MEKNISDLAILSKNKYNINLLETIEHKELFKNLNYNLRNTKFNNFCKNKTDFFNNNNKNFKIKEEDIKLKKALTI